MASTAGSVTPLASSSSSSAEKRAEAQLSGQRNRNRSRMIPFVSTGGARTKKSLAAEIKAKAKAQITHAQSDDLIDFYHLKSRKGMSQLELEDEIHDDLKRATGEFTKDGDDANKLNRVLQLTGFSDPVYAEAYVTVPHYDVVLDVTVINRTKFTLQNLCLELATMGDLKLVERPQNYTLAPESSKQIKANIKVSSTET